MMRLPQGSDLAVYELAEDEYLFLINHAAGADSYVSWIPREPVIIRQLFLRAMIVAEMGYGSYIEFHDPEVAETWTPKLWHGTRVGLLGSETYFDSRIINFHDIPFKEKTSFVWVVQSTDTAVTAMLHVKGGDSPDAPVQVRPNLKGRPALGPKEI